MNSPFQSVQAGRLPAPRPTHALRRWLFLVIPVGLGWAGPCPAAQRTWDGGGRSADWTDAANWSGALAGAPVAGDDLRFPVAALRLNNNNDPEPGNEARGRILH